MSDLMDAAQIAERLSTPTHQRSADWVQRKMSSHTWPHTKVGKFRGMTERQFQETLSLLAVTPAPREQSSTPSGLSPRSKLRKTA